MSKQPRTTAPGTGANHRATGSHACPLQPLGPQAPLTPKSHISAVYTGTRVPPTARHFPLIFTSLLSNTRAKARQHNAIALERGRRLTPPTPSEIRFRRRARARRVHLKGANRRFCGKSQRCMPFDKHSAHAGGLCTASCGIIWHLRPGPCSAPSSLQAVSLPRGANIATE